jgi:hypothetical protein
MAKTGRRTDYNPEIAEAICAGIAEGLLLPEVCMPIQEALIVEYVRQRD